MSAKQRVGKIIACDWDERTLRLVHAQMGKRGVSIDRLLSVAIPKDVHIDDPEQLGRHIRQVLDQAGISTRRAVVDIPRDQSVLNTLTLPTSVPDELPGMVQIQIAKELPFPVSEAAVDFTTETVQAGAVSGDVLVAAVRREVLDRYEATMTAAGLKLDRVGLRPYANKMAVCALLKHGMPQRVLFLDVRPHLTEMNVLRNGALVFSRAASVFVPSAPDAESGAESGSRPALSLVIDGSTDTAEGSDGAGDDLGGDEQAGTVTAESAIRALVVEVTRSIEAYRANDPGATIDHVVIAGDLGVEEKLSDAIRKRLDISTELYNPGSTFGWEPDEGVGAAAFAASLGLVLGHADAEPTYFDFLHPKKTVSATQKRLQKAPLAAAVAGLFLTSVAVGGYYYTKPERDHVAQLEQIIADLKGNVSDNKKFLKFMSEVEAFDAQLVWVDVLDDVIRRLPPNQELVVHRIDMKQKDARVTLKTVAKHRDTTSKARQALESFRREGRELPRFQVAMGAQSEKRGEGYPYVQDLRITVLDDEGKKVKRRSRG